MSRAAVQSSLECWCLVIFPALRYSDLAIEAGGVRAGVIDPGRDEHLVTSAPVMIFAGVENKFMHIITTIICLCTNT